MDALPQTDAPEPFAPGMADDTIPRLVREVYRHAPLPARSRIVSHLLQPLGLLSLAGIGGGIFFQLRFRDDMAARDLRPEDLVTVSPEHVLELARHAQAIAVEVVDGLSQVISDTPSLLGTSAAALLVALLSRRASSRSPGAVEEWGA